MALEHLNLPPVRTKSVPTFYPKGMISLICNNRNVTNRAVPRRSNEYLGTKVSYCQRRLAAWACKMRGMVGRAFCNKKRGEEKMKKVRNIYIILNARSDIRAAVCLVLDLYGFIITVNC